MNIRARERDRSLGDENQLPHHLAPEAHRRHRQGQHQIRFCQYSSKGSFLRPPLIINKKTCRFCEKRFDIVRSFTLSPSNSSSLCLEDDVDQALAEGRADTSSYQRLRLDNDSGMGTRAAPAAKSHVQSAVMSAIEKLSPAIKWLSARW